MHTCHMFLNVTHGTHSHQSLVTCLKLNTFTLSLVLYKNKFISLSTRLSFTFMYRMILIAIFQCKCSTASPDCGDTWTEHCDLLTCHCMKYTPVIRLQVGWASDMGSDYHNIQISFIRSPGHKSLNSLSDKRTPEICHSYLFHLQKHF